MADDEPRNTCDRCPRFITGRLYFRCTPCAMAERLARNEEEATRG